MKFRKAIASLALLTVLPTAVACGADTSSESASLTTSSSTSTTTSGSTSGSTTDSTTESATGSTTTDGGPPAGGLGAGGPGGIDPSSVTTEEQLIELIQEAYGDAGLDLHRGHQPVQDVLDEVLTISHDELHVRMEEQGQNLAAVAEDLGIDPQTLIDALVESWSPAIDNLLADGTITQDEGDAYRAALEEAFTFRVTWDGSEATPTFDGLDA